MPVRARFGPFVFDDSSRQLLRDGLAVHLSPKAFDLLAILLTHRPDAVRKADLHERIWPGTFVVDANLTVLVAELRRALGDEAQDPHYIRTIHRHGYAFCADAVDLEPRAALRRGETTPRTWLAWRDRVLLLAAGDNVIGRDPHCDIWLDVPGVSRRHARVTVESDAAYVQDLGSKNGTFIGEDAVTTPRRIEDGDAIQLGPEQLTFRMWSRGRTPETIKIVRPPKPAS